jgi:shikimate dehydrogenase
MNSSRFRFGLIGERIDYSLSPRIFEWGFKQSGIDGSYEVISLRQDELIGFLRSAGREFHGLNVTVPHKSAIVEQCAKLSATAARVGAVNAIRWSGGEWCGDNFDVSGFGHAMDRLFVDSRKPRHALVIGAGGAARAAICALVDRQVSVTVAVRDRMSAERRLSGFHEPVQNIVLFGDVASALSQFDFVVQATSASRFFSVNGKSELHFDVQPSAKAMDMIYSPRETPFQLRARTSGAKAMNGLPMLIAQAAAAFTNWTGTGFPLERALRELLPELERE